jgi:hypothetical protein
VPPQLPSVVTFTGGLGDADGTEDDWLADADETVVDDEGEDGVDPVQLPKEVWHPAPQCADVEPLCS